MTIAGYKFSGPWVLPTTLRSVPGVYVVLCEAQYGYRVVEVGESVDVMNALDGHERKCCSSTSCSGALRFAAHYCDAAERRKVVNDVRKQIGPPCRHVLDLAGNVA